MGGGIGVPYKPQEEEMEVGELAMNLTDMIQEETDIGTIILEPGRYIVCDTTVLLTRVNDVKDAGTKKYVGCDAGFNTLIRPAMYDSYHYVALANKFGRACTDKYDVVGPICESGDYLAHDRVLPDPKEGDIVAVYNAGTTPAPTGSPCPATTTPAPSARRSWSTTARRSSSARPRPWRSSGGTRSSPRGS